MVSRQQRRTASRSGTSSWLGAALLAMTGALSAPALAQSSSDAFCADPMAQCGGLIQENCLERLGASSISVAEAGECRAQVDQYRSCVSRIARECGSTTLSGSGSAPDSRNSETDARIYCQRQTDSCLTAVNDDYRDCRDTGGNSCRGDCREERDLARESCNDALRTCLATGGYRAAAFVYPSCASPGSNNARAGDPAPVKPGAGSLPTPVSGAGAICRNGVYYCFMFQPGPVGAPCSCTGNPAMGVPPFQGMISPQ